MTRITIDKLCMGGAGLGEVDGKKVFVDYAAPGDVLDITITKAHGSYAEARIERIEEPASCRVTPPCPVFGICGGCQWQHIRYETQLEWKQRILEETLARIGGIENPEVAATLPSPKEWNYRNRIQLHVNSKGDVGFYRPKSKKVVAFDRCLIADERINDMLVEQRAEIAGRDRGIALRLGHGSHFSQVNAAQNEQVKGVLVEWLGEVPHETVVELYAGSGNFTFAVAKIAHEVIAVEIDGRAVKWAQDHIEQEKIPNVTFLRSPAHRMPQALHEESLGVVFLDPPRRGAAEAVDAIVALKPQTIIYMSCNPATMARDVKMLCERGWGFTKSLPIDMFPQTFHIESLTMLTRS